MPPEPKQNLLTPSTETVDPVEKVVPEACKKPFPKRKSRHNPKTAQDKEGNYRQFDISSTPCSWVRFLPYQINRKKDKGVSQRNTSNSYDRSEMKGGSLGVRKMMTNSDPKLNTCVLIRTMLPRLAPWPGTLAFIVARQLPFYLLVDFLSWWVGWIHWFEINTRRVRSSKSYPKHELNSRLTPGNHLDFSDADWFSI